MFESSAEAQDRTGDTAIFSRVLYQLSYLGSAHGKGAELATGILAELGGIVNLDETSHIVYTYFSAEVAELADAHDSKSCGLCPCGFDSHLRHHPVERAACETSWRPALLGGPA